MRNLEGKVAVVTGAASGIGRETALALAQKGCRVAVCDLNEDGLAETKRLLEAETSDVTTHRVDVSKRSEMEAFAEAVLDAHGPASIVVNNAGVTIIASFEEHSIEDIEWILGINLWGVIYGCKFFLPQLKRAGEGHIVNVSSIFGVIAPPDQTSYCMSKFAVRGLSESLRGEVAEHHIGVTSVHPGTIQTNIVKAARFLDPETKQTVRDRILRTFDRFGTGPEVVAERIIQAIENNSPRVVVTKEAHLADVLKRVMPATTDGLVTKIFNRVRAT